MATGIRPSAHTTSLAEPTPDPTFAVVQLQAQRRRLPLRFASKGQNGDTWRETRQGGCRIIFRDRSLSSTRYLNQARPHNCRQGSMRAVVAVRERGNSPSKAARASKQAAEEGGEGVGYHDLIKGITLSARTTAISPVHGAGADRRRAAMKQRRKSTAWWTTGDVECRDTGARKMSVLHLHGASETLRPSRFSLARWLAKGNKAGVISPEDACWCTLRLDVPTEPLFSIRTFTSSASSFFSNCKEAPLRTGYPVGNTLVQPAIGLTANAGYLTVLYISQQGAMSGSSHSAEIGKRPGSA